jgi:Fe-S-cluster-containing hydrogenase component 2
LKRSNKKQNLAKGPARGVSRMQATPKRSGAILADTSICHGCGICELVCSLSHSGACGPAQSSIHLFRDPLAGEYLLTTCRQCDFPSCYFTCPMGAIVIEPKTGARVIDDERCEGCGACAKACPFNERENVIKPDLARGAYFKCDLCSGLGRAPLCVEACPWGALRYIPANER